MESLLTFLPLDRRRALAANTPLPDRVVGAALFADISGFTPLTAVLASELGSHRGAEVLTQIINQVYTDLIAEVHRCLGSVINFSGDAITCWFDDTAVPTNAAHYALTCALAMQQAMQRYTAVATPGGTTFTLGLKVAIASGSARRFLVGDPTSQVIEVLAGTTLDRMAAAEKQAVSGDIIVTPDVLNQLPVSATISGWRTDKTGNRYASIADLAANPTIAAPTADFALPDGSIAGKVVYQWVISPVYERLLHAPDSFLAELRPAVSLFIKFSGIDYDHDDEAGDKLDTFVRQIQQIVDHYEGFLLQITMGDKGSYLYVAFGAPITHEDDAARAAAAALEIKELATRLPYISPLQMGISQGLTHSGACGSPLRRTYAVMGNHVNIAARLMGQANPGEILVSRPVAAVIEGLFVLNPLPPVQLKGIDEPFALWQLAARQTKVLRKLQTSGIHMVGREAELAILLDALARLQDSRSTICLVEGAAGLGKSTLIETMLDKMDQDSAVALIGAGDAIEQSTAYYVWRAIIEQIVGRSDSLDSPAAWRERVLDIVDPNLWHLVPLLNPILPLDIEDTELTAYMTGEARQENMHRLVVSLLQSALADQPLLLVVEDAHWLDSASWTLLRRVSREVKPLVIVLVTRPFTDDMPSVYREFVEMPITHRLILDVLPLNIVDELVCQRLGVASLPTAVANLIHDKAEGHPFFSEELAYALREGGLIEVADGHCRLMADVDDFTAMDFPNTIQGVIMSRIDMLAPLEQLTLKVASVIGRVFAYRLLHAIYPSTSGNENPELRRHLERLERLDITPMETPDPHLAYLFKHIVTREVAYGLMTYAQRQQLHENTAVWYETYVQDGDSARINPLLAYHWHEAGNITKAVHYYSMAGEDAYRNYANQEAIRLLNQAVTLSEEDVPPLQIARWLRQMGEAAYRLTLMQQSIDHYTEALEMLDQHLPATNAAKVWRLLGELGRQAGYRLLPKLTLTRAETAVAREKLLETWQVLDGMSEIFYNAGDFLTTFYCVIRAFNLAEQAGPSSELVSSYANMCATWGTVSLHSVADRHRNYALEMAADIDDPATLAYIQVPLSSYSLWVGNWARAEQEIDTGLKIYEQLGEWRRWCVLAWTWPQVVQGQGDLQRAKVLWAEVTAVARRTYDTRHEVRSLGGQFFNHLALGEIAAATECVEMIGAVLEENPEMKPVEERLWFAVRAIAALQQEQWAEAHELALAQLEAVARARMKYDLLEVFAASSHVLLVLWQHGEATASEVKQGLKLLQGYARTYPFARPRLLRYQAQYAWGKGKHGRAKKLWQRSLQRAQALGMQYEQALTLAARGEFLAADGDRQQAAVIADEIGAVLADTAVTPPPSATPGTAD